LALDDVVNSDQLFEAREWILVNVGLHVALNEHENWSFKMKLNLRHAVWALTLAVAVLGAPAIAAAQAGWDAQGNPIYDKNSPQITPAPNDKGDGRYGQHGQDRQDGRNQRHGNNIQKVAYDNGFQAGERYGQTDRNTGHSNRPTYSSTYKNGTSGYNSSMGNKSAYRSAFQQGFREGYAQGYNQRHRR
jgi:hypothetical protein